MWDHLIMVLVKGVLVPIPQCVIPSVQYWNIVSGFHSSVNSTPCCMSRILNAPFCHCSQPWFLHSIPGQLIRRPLCIKPMSWLGHLAYMQHGRSVSIDKKVHIHMHIYCMYIYTWVHVQLIQCKLQYIKLKLYINYIPSVTTLSSTRAVAVYIWRQLLTTSI